MFTKFSEHKLHKNDKNGAEVLSTNDLKSENRNSLQNSELIQNCRDANQLINILPEREFEYDEEQSLIICTLCNESSIPCASARLKKNKVGIFIFDLHSYYMDLEQDPHKQPRNFINLKHSMISHEQGSRLHLSLKEKSDLKKKESESNQARNIKIGINLFNLRYIGMIHGKSYLNFEEDVLTANLNGTDTGNTNNGCDFAKDLTCNIVAVMKDTISENLSKPIDATKKLRPVGMVADKITPNKRTGHITALIMPIPENPLSKPLLDSVMLEMPPVIDHTADGLSTQMLDLFHGAGVEDSQLEGVGVDGQYIKLGAIKKLISKLDVDGYSEEQLQKWIFVTWDPSHNLNKADEEIRQLQIFDWLVSFTNDVGDITRTLGIGKGLEQCKQAASDLDKTLYKLQTYSATRFAAYVEKVYENIYKSYEIIIRALGVRAESDNKKVRETAKDLLSKLLTTKFLGTLLGCIDIYRVIATSSCNLQRVEQFPWEVISNLNYVIKKNREYVTDTKHFEV